MQQLRDKAGYHRFYSGRFQGDWNSERAADYYKTSPNTLIICFNTTKHVKAAEELKMILSSPQADASSKAVKSWGKYNILDILF